MGTLEARLAQVHTAFEATAPAAALAVMHRATADLVNSRILEGVPAAGSALPPFELPDTDGHLVSSAELLQRGPLVITYYRGHW